MSIFSWMFSGYYEDIDTVTIFYYLLILLCLSIYSFINDFHFNLLIIWLKQNANKNLARELFRSVIVIFRITMILNVMCYEVRSVFLVFICIITRIS